MPPTSHARQPLPLDPPRNLYLFVLRKARSLSSTSTTGRRAQLSSATWYWRHRVDASDGESGGRGAYCDEDEHARPAAAPSHLQSSFCHTCCPYRGLCAVWHAAGGEGGGTQRRAVKFDRCDLTDVWCGGVEGVFHCALCVWVSTIIQNSGTQMNSDLSKF